jgi:hypothetical protein
MPVEYTSECRLPNSSAGPLPMAFCSAEIPLSAGSTNLIQMTDKSHILNAARVFFEG